MDDIPSETIPDSFSDSLFSVLSCPLDDIPSETIPDSFSDSLFSVLSCLK
jgi:hypothetical protein